MAKCGYCGVEILDATEVCPLCRGVVDNSIKVEEWRQNTYPDVVAKRRHEALVLRILLAAWVFTTIVCVTVNIQTKPYPLWSAVVSASVLYVLYVLKVMLDRDSGYLKRMFVTIIGGMLLTLIIDVVFGFLRWSVNFVLPGMLFVINFAMLLLMLINRRNWQSYMILQILSIIIGLVPLGLIYMGIVTRPILSEIAFISSVMVFLGTLIIGGGTARSELKRRFHI